MSTDLIKVESYTALSAESAMAEAREANGETLTASMLTRVKTPTGGMTSWEIDDGLGNIENVREISGALVLYRKRATLWGTTEQAIEGALPYLVVDDHPALERGYLIPGGDPGDLDTELIDACRYDDGSGDIDVRDKAHGGCGFPYSEWASNGKEGSRGKRLKEQRVIAVLRPNDMFPLILTIQPGSLARFIPLIAKLKKPYWYYAIRLWLTETKNAAGQKYSQVNMAVIPGVFPEEVAAKLKADYVDPLAAAFSQRMVAIDE